MALAANSVTDTSKSLWEFKFLCRIPDLQSRSIEHIKFFGVPSTGDPNIDKDLSQQWITTYITIDDMVEYYKKGVPVKVVNQPDVKKIYDYISAHLNAWKNQISFGLNIGDAPIEDLVDMDRFANIVYEHAKYHFQESTAGSIMANTLSATVRFNQFNFFKPEVKITTNDDLSRAKSEEVDPYPKREELADLFKDRKITTRRWSQ